MKNFIPPLALLFILGGCTDVIKSKDGAKSKKEKLESLPYVPQRIISINPCADATLLAVANKDQIIALSHYSRDARASVIGVEVAKQFATTYQTAEEVIALRPDLVIAGSHVSFSTVTALQRLKIPIVNLKVPETIEQSTTQIQLVANLTGHKERGENLIKAINEAKKLNQNSEKIPAIIWQNGGLVPGKGTLSDELLNLTGFRNKSGDYGLKKWDKLGLEPMLADPPKELITTTKPDNLDRILSHRVLRKASEIQSPDTKITISDYDRNFMACSGPVLINSLNRLGEIHREYAVKKAVN